MTLLLPSRLLLFAAAVSLCHYGSAFHLHGTTTAALQKRRSASLVTRQRQHLPTMTTRTLIQQQRSKYQHQQHHLTQYVGDPFLYKVPTTLSLCKKHQLMMEPSQSDATYRQPPLPRRVLNSLGRRIRFLPWIRKKVLTAAVVLLVVLSTATGANAAAVTAGRSGGSFGPSSSSRSSSSRPSSSYRINAPPPQIRVYRDPSPVITVFMRPARTLVFPQTSRPWDYAPAATSMKASDILLLTGTGTLIAYGFANNYRQQQSGPLGPGATVATVTVALQVPKRHNRKSNTNANENDDILSKIRRYSEQADTSTRKGVQALVSQVALEILRQEKSVLSASTRYSHFRTADLAQRDFQRQSIQNRAKFDRESVNKFGNEDHSERAPRPITSALDPEATMAIVVIHMAVEGDSTQLPAIRFRKDLQDSLARIASDAQVDECLLSAEILWAPEESYEVLTMDDVYVDYPDLIPL